jgi:hypothetical protein
VSGFRLSPLLFVFGLLTAPVQAQTPTLTPGLWKVTTTTILNGKSMPPQVKERCLSAEQAADPVKSFSPEYATVNSDCERTALTSDARTLSWRLQCKGQIDMDVSADFVFENAKRYTATIVTKGAMAGQQMMASSAAIEGEHVGDCR